MRLTPQQKEDHCLALRLLSALAIEHGLRFLKADDPVRKIIEEDITLVREGSSGRAKRRFAVAQRRKADYTPAGLLLQGSKAMLGLAKHGGYPSGNSVQSVFYFPTEAGFLVDKPTYGYGVEQQAENQWQNENLWPLLRRLFEQWGNPNTLAQIKDVKVAA